MQEEFEIQKHSMSTAFIRQALFFQRRPLNRILALFFPKESRKIPVDLPLLTLRKLTILGTVIRTACTLQTEESKAQPPDPILSERDTQPPKLCNHSEFVWCTSTPHLKYIRQRELLISNSLDPHIRTLTP